MPTDAKVALIEELADAGLPVVEATSFVSPPAVPQLADADEVLPARASPARRPLSGAGAEHARPRARAKRAGADAVAVFTAASEAFTEREHRHDDRRVARRVRDRCSTARPSSAGGDAGTSRPRSAAPTRATSSAARGRAGLPRRCSSSAATRSRSATRSASPSPTTCAESCDALLEQMPVERLALHLHDTGGRALDNVEAGLELGIAMFDSSAGGTGGCPFAPGAPGNLATEALLRAARPAGHRSRRRRRKGRGGRARHQSLVCTADRSLTSGA